jgi:hypothetical protein
MASVDPSSHQSYKVSILEIKQMAVTMEIMRGRCRYRHLDGEMGARGNQGRVSADRRDNLARGWTSAADL